MAHDPESPEMTAPALDDTVERFSSDLRLLGIAAGSPTLVHLRHQTRLSRTVISEAFAGKQLPSARTVAGIVAACDGDPAEWIRRRDALSVRAADRDAEAAEDGAGDADDAPRLPAKQTPRRFSALLAVLGLVVGPTLGAGITWAVENTRIVALEKQLTEVRAELKAAGPVNPRAQIQVRTGIDPAMTPCVNDAKVVASEDRPHNSRLQIVWSNKCYAGWARIARYDGKAEGNLVKVSIYPETAPDGPDRQDATEPGVQGAYTTLTVRPSPQTRLCAIGSLTLDGEELSLGNPICA